MQENKPFIFQRFTQKRSFDSEDERPPISRLIMECDLSVNQELREKRVRRRVRDINEALGLKENNK